MTDEESVAAQPLSADDPTVTPWAEARERLAEGNWYWLATARPDGRPHVRPVLGVWLDGALYFCTSPASRKGKNLAREARCAITAASDALHLVVEGEAAKVSDDATLRRVAKAYASKYGWQVTVRDGALYGDGAPTAGPPPYGVYVVTPTTVFGFGTDDSFSPTRWRFPRRGPNEGRRDTGSKGGGQTPGGSVPGRPSEDLFSEDARRHVERHGITRPATTKRPPRVRTHGSETNDRSKYHD